MDASGTIAVDVAGISLPVWRAGRGQPLLLLDGGDGFHRSSRWRALLAEEWDVHAPKYPGYGGVAFAPHVKGVGELALVCLEYLDALDLRDVLLVGASFGGWLAAEVAIRSSERIAGVVLIDPLGIKRGGRTDQTMTDIYSALPEEKPALLYATSEQRDFDYSGMSDEAVAAVVQDREAEAYYGWKPAFFNPTLDRWLFRLRRPTKIIWGSQDRFVDPDYGAAFAARVPGAEFAVIEGAGHYPHVEKPEETYRELRDFAARRTRPS